MFRNLFHRKPDIADPAVSVKLSKEEIADLLRTTPEALKAFEDSYRAEALSDNDTLEDFFSMNSRDASELSKKTHPGSDTSGLTDRIVEEFLEGVSLYQYRKGHSVKVVNAASLPDKDKAVKKEEIYALPKQIRPQCTPYLQKRDIGVDASEMILMSLKEAYDKDNPPEKRKLAYHLFRQGLDIQDIDPIMYEMLGMNKNSMGYWLPEIVSSVETSGFFKIPDTTIMKVPMNILQLSRCGYEELTRTTLDIVDKVCFRAFALDVKKDYFIKTGTYSSKFDFRNAHVHGEKEVRELGEYLLFIQHQACQMASPLTQPTIYGVSTTNEWVVREFIRDKEQNPRIYKGLPLHTEYRVFADFDKRTVLSMTPYWEPGMMKKRFAEGADRSIHDLHDFAIYASYEDVLMKRYNENAGRIKEEVQRLLDLYDGKLYGQWSIDIMQNDRDFWLIDMALAESSAFYTDCVPEEARRPIDEDWIPRIPERGLSQKVS